MALHYTVASILLEPRHHTLTPRTGRPLCKLPRQRHVSRPVTHKQVSGQQQGIILVTRAKLELLQRVCKVRRQRLQ